MANAATSTASLANLRPFKAGPDPRRYMGGPLSPAERAFRKCLEEEHIPRASDLLTSMFDAGMAGDVKAAELFFKVCGLIKKPSDDAAIQELAHKLLDGMISEARSRRAGGQVEPQPEGRVIDVGTEEE